MLLALKTEKEATSGQPLETGKRKEVGSPREMLEGVRPCQYPDFSPGKSITDA